MDRQTDRQETAATSRELSPAIPAVPLKDPGASKHAGKHAGITPKPSASSSPERFHGLLALEPPGDTRLFYFLENIRGT